MRTSGAGVRFIQSFEQLRLDTYLDQAGRPTIGYGHLIEPGEDFHAGITEDRADQIFVTDLVKKAEDPVGDAFDIDLEQNQFDALVSLCFNIGSGNFSKSSLVRIVKNGSGTADDVRAHFCLWDKVNIGGVLTPSDGLLARRNAEADIYLQGVYNNHI